MNVTVSHATTDEVAKPVPFTEVHMDRPLADTIREMVAAGGSYEGELPEEAEGWAGQAFVKDPSGNILLLWKCPPSRTWEEPEAGYDKEE
jgi:hypothetical protein